MDEMQQWPKEAKQCLRDLEIKNQNLQEENQKLRSILPGIEKRLRSLELENLELRNENKKLKDKIRILEKRLYFYENSNTPPSARKFPQKKKQDTKKSGKTKKRGAPKGHNGATRPTPEPDQQTEVIADECEQCGSKNIQDMDELKKRIIEDFLHSQESTVIQFDRHKMKCMDCGHEFISKHPDCPQKGNFGINLLVHITMLKFHLRGVLRRIEDFLFFENNFRISTKGVHDILLRVGTVCKITYEDQIQRIRNARWVHIDETGIKIKGEKYWLWIFRTDADDVLVVIKKSRSSKVPDEILGSDWNKPIIVDGWKAYWKYLIIQRCWAHLLRKIDEYKECSDHGAELSEVIHRCFDKLKAFLETDSSMSERRKQKEIFDREIENIVEKFSRFKELDKAITHLKNGLDKWYTCILYPGMEPTNNLGEHAMREHVIMRKIIGCFRSKRGAENYQYIASLLASWKLQDKNVFEELENLLRIKLCLS